MSERLSLATVGIGFVAAFLLYGGGQYLVGEGSSAPGLALILVNSIVVIAIGLILRPIIAATAPGISLIYLGARILEGVLLAAGAIALVSLGDARGADANALAYRGGMIVLSLGGAAFCHWMLWRRRVPMILAAWGILGYLALGVAMVLDHFGQSTLSMWLLLPGGFFELIFGFWLILFGLRTVTE